MGSTPDEPNGNRPAVSGVLTIVRPAVALLCLALLPTAAGAGNAPVLPPGAGMEVERAAHTATLLRDGRVLVAGGIRSGEAALASAELYDPEQRELQSGRRHDRPARRAHGDVAARRPPAHRRRLGRREHNCARPSSTTRPQAVSRGPAHRRRLVPAPQRRSCATAGCFLPRAASTPAAASAAPTCTTRKRGGSPARGRCACRGPPTRLRGCGRPSAPGGWHLERARLTGG